MTPLLRCEQHGATAGWQCTVCHQPLCPDCAALKTIPPVTLVACGRCGEHAEALVRKRGEAESLARRLPRAFLFPFRGEGLPLWLGMGLWLWVTALAGAGGVLIGWGAALGTLFGVTRSTARDHERLDLSDFSDFISGVVLPVVRLAVTGAPVWVGLALSLWLDRPWIGWVALVIGALWSPTAYIGAATGTNLVHLLNPVRVLGVSARLGKDLGVYLAALGAVAVLMLVSVPVSALIDRIWAPVVAGVAAKMVLIYGPLVSARIAGLVLLLHGNIFGGEELDAWEPVLGATQPRGELPQKTSTLPTHLPAAIELEPEALPPPQPAVAHERFAALELSPNAAPPPEVAPLDVALLPSHGERAAKEIRAAVRAGKVEVALDGFRATGLAAAPSLSFDELLWLAQSAASHIDYESAELAFRQAVERKAPPEALGRARVMLARLLAERRGRKDEARTLMERVVTEHAGTPAASYAQQWLSQP